MKKIIRKFSSLVTILALLNVTSAMAKDVKLRNVVLPTDIKNIPKAPGSVFYGAGPDAGALMPVHIWGEVRKSGLYYIPVNSTLIQGISLAGGTIPSSDLSEVVVKRVVEGNVTEEELDLSSGGDQSSYHYKLKSGDTIFIAKDTHLQDRAFYTGLVSVVFTLLSTIVLFKKIDDE